ETRRRRDAGHDWCVVSLGIPGLIRRVVIDTSHFTGNYPEQFSLDASPGGDVWDEVIPLTSLSGDATAGFDVDYPHRVAAVRLNIHPDGGVARLRVAGEPIPNMQAVCPDGDTDLASSTVGGRWLEASDFHYSPPSNLLLPTEPEGMWDGWETKRRRGGGHDWATFRLGLPGTLTSVVVDTTHFKGNSPGWVSLDISEDATTWSEIVERVAVDPDASNEIDLPSTAHATCVRLSIHPDGGVARFRVMGRPDPEAASQARLAYLNSLFDEAARGFFLTACVAPRWVDAMVSARPFSSVEEVFASMRVAFAGLAESDWLQAFAAHPRIGERGDATANKEQAGTASASREMLNDLVDVNRRYEEKFGFTYIVYATGKSAAEMLELARGRLGNDRPTEIAAAAAEQRKITETRLRRMLCLENP
ncbi:MAG: 2-oxo-4-hydroxy-4-carboxy-5-ureidoimidazoline decarboxylase, partial [Acidimicrobiia bacterium]